MADGIQSAALKIFSAKIEELSEYQDIPKFEAFCMQCPNYGKKWACPPHFFDIKSFFRGRRHAHIVAMKIPTDTFAGKGGNIDVWELAKKITDMARLEFDELLLEAEKRHPNSLALFAGTCANCPEDVCPRENGLPCVRPEKMRQSLESLGYDVAAISEEKLGIKMLWAKDGRLPPYLTLVGALISNEPEAALAQAELHRLIR